MMHVSICRLVCTCQLLYCTTGMLTNCSYYSASYIWLQNKIIAYCVQGIVKNGYWVDRDETPAHQKWAKSNCIKARWKLSYFWSFALNPCFLSLFSIHSFFPLLFFLRMLISSRGRHQWSHIIWKSCSVAGIIKLDVSECSRSTFNQLLISKLSDWVDPQWKNSLSNFSNIQEWVVCLMARRRNVEQIATLEMIDLKPPPITCLHEVTHSYWSKIWMWMDCLLDFL